MKRLLLTASPVDTITASVGDILVQLLAAGAVGLAFGVAWLSFVRGWRFWKWLSR